MYAFMGLRSFEILLIVFSLSTIILPVIALIDVVRSDFLGQNDKLIWVVVIVFLNVIGSLLYFFIGRNQRIA